MLCRCCAQIGEFEADHLVLPKITRTKDGYDGYGECDETFEHSDE